jgi:hypothetical protein
MPVVNLVLASGRAVNFEIDTALTGSAYFVLSVRRSGSTMFNSICEWLAVYNTIRFVDVGTVFFDANVTEKDFSADPALAGLIFPGNVYGGFRSMPVALGGNAIFETSRKLLFVRDPRDALVSQYFSDAYSHPLPAAGSAGDVNRMLERQRAYALQSPIDEYVKKRARAMRTTMAEYESILASSLTTVLKYEDYISRKGELIRLIAERFEWKTDDALVAETLAWADRWPTQEDRSSFIRKVTPGDHREKLKPATIAWLNEKLQPVMEMYGYDPNK